MGVNTYMIGCECRERQRTSVAKSVARIRVLYCTMFRNRYIRAYEAQTSISLHKINKYSIKWHAKDNALNSACSKRPTAR